AIFISAKKTISETFTSVTRVQIPSGSPFNTLYSRSFPRSTTRRCQPVVTPAQHEDDSAVGIYLGPRRGDDFWRNGPAVRVRHVDVPHRLGDALVPHPGHERPGVHAKHRRVGAEGMAEEVPPLERKASSLADPLHR